MAEQNQGRRPHYHRGRRGSDRRGPDRRTGAASQEQGARDQQDVEQIMREIRARIAQRHGIELTTQQIQELAARRLEAILDPRTVNPSLLEQLRRSAGRAPDLAPQAPSAYEFEDRTIYESHNGLLRWIRKVLNPLLKLFFNPNPIAHALNAQAKLNATLAAREAERDRLQAEWNALHYDLLQRVVTETARVSLEMQSLASRVESLNARVDFNDRRVRTMEAAATGGRQPQRQQDRPPASTAPTAAAAPEPVAEGRAEPGAAGDGARRRRRRRRGRRSGLVPGEAVPAGADAAALAESEADGEAAEFEDNGDDDATQGPEEAEPSETVQAAATLPAPLPPPAAVDETPTPEPAPAEPAAEPAAPPAPAEPATAAAAPAPFPTDEEGAATTPPSPPRDEPSRAGPEPQPEPEER